MTDQATETVRTRPRAREVPPTISTTQELPPPPPGWWARLWSRIRVSRHTRPVLILVPVAAILVAGVVSGRGDRALVPPPQREDPAPAAIVDPGVLAQWRTNAEPVLADIERDVERVTAAVAADEPALAVLHCRDVSERVATWAQALVPAPDPELDTELRAALELLGRAFETCSTASLESVGNAMETLDDAGTHFTRAQARLAELAG